MDMLRLGIRGALGLTLALGALTACGDDSGDGGSTPVADASTQRPDSSTPSSDAGTKPDSGSSVPDSGAAAKTIVDIAVADGRFTTLAKALTDTGLVGTLQGAGPFTVFAPTDAAFAALPPGTLAGLSNEQLKTILSYHVIAKAVPSSALKAGPVATVSKFSAFVSLTGGVKVNDASVTTADISASNGVIHVIDKVLLPPNLVQAAQYAGSFSSLLGAVTKAGLADTLAGANANLTVFAPTDAAFAALPPGTVDGLSVSALGDLLKYHVVSGQKLSTDLTTGSVPTLLTGKSVTVSLAGGVKINDANVVLADVVTTNGVIHAIDKVLTVPN
ncbi:MAG: hypothetical protein JWN48_2898 [Myxococcaceae bacterium]|nr:hypothetical protein [Myxococcaceae bacterium]